MSNICLYTSIEQNPNVWYMFQSLGACKGIWILEIEDHHVFLFGRGHDERRGVSNFKGDVYGNGLFCFFWPYEDLIFVVSVDGLRKKEKHFLDVRITR